MDFFFPKKIGGKWMKGEVCISIFAQIEWKSFFCSTDGPKREEKRGG